MSKSDIGCEILKSDIGGIILKLRYDIRGTAFRCVIGGIILKSDIGGIILRV